jgi:hypothetical protein
MGIADSPNVVDGKLRMLSVRVVDDVSPHTKAHRAILDLYMPVATILR